MAEEEIVIVSENDGMNIWIREDAYEVLEREARKEGKTVEEKVFEHIKHCLEAGVI